MRSLFARSALLATLLFACLPIHAEVTRAERAICTRMIRAIETANHAEFVAAGDETFQQTPKERFAADAAPIAARLRSGYTTTLLGDLRQSGMRRTLWKIAFKDGSDDLLVEINFGADRVIGFGVR
jgi:hypothetical protein